MQQSTTEGDAEHSVQYIAPRELRIQQWVSIAYYIQQIYDDLTAYYLGPDRDKENRAPIPAKRCIVISLKTLLGEDERVYPLALYCLRACQDKEIKVFFTHEEAAERPMTNADLEARIGSVRFFAVDLREMSGTRRILDPTAVGYFLREHKYHIISVVGASTRGLDASLHTLRKYSGLPSPMQFLVPNIVT